LHCIIDEVTKYCVTLWLCECRVEDYVSAPFLIDKLSLYKDGDNADKFFRPAVRSLLVITYHLR